MAKEMNIQQCVVCAKFYDVDSFDKCPHCGADKERTNKVNEKKDKSGASKSIFSFINKKDEKEKKSDDINKTESNVDDISSTVQEIVEEPKEEDKKDERINIIPVAPKKEIMDKPEERVVSNKKTDDDNMKTEYVYPTQKNNNPVVGWLVCTVGECQGDSFEIRSGSNKLGRGSDSDIYIEDMTISREQGNIKFEPDSQRFYLIPNNDSDNWIYVNGECKSQVVCLEPYASIRIGEKAKFIFIPLCGESFNWKDYLEE